MLISRRKEGDALSIGDDVEIRIVDVRKNKVILGIIAPRNVKITAAKLSDVAMANTMAAVNATNIGQFFAPQDTKSERVVLLLESTVLKGDCK
jgi:carbon storage regulator